MFEELEKAIADLNHTRAGWVTRRDAALALGQYARHALHTLKAHREDADVDIRKAVHDAITQIDQPPSGPPKILAPSGTPKPINTLKDLVQTIEKPNLRTVRPFEDGYLIDVQIDRERSQTVYVKSHEKPEEARHIRIFTYCGAADSKTSLWALRANIKMTDCAFAVIHENENDRLITVRNLSWENASPDVFKAVVKQIALYGDWFEKKTSDKDIF